VKFGGKAQGKLVMKEDRADNGGKSAMVGLSSGRIHSKGMGVAYR
jgi:hypothetical protein